MIGFEEEIESETEEGKQSLAQLSRYSYADGIRRLRKVEI